MRNAGLKFVVLFSLYVCTILACGEAESPPHPTIASEAADLNNVVTKLPEAPGYAAFERNCQSCHSARYVQMQPNFPEKTWLALVTKMQKTFGAPVPDSSIKEIVQYLVAIKGKS